MVLFLNFDSLLFRLVLLFTEVVDFADVFEVPEVLVVVEGVSDNELVRNLEASVVRGVLVGQGRPLAEQRRNSNAPRAILKGETEECLKQIKQGFYRCLSHTHVNQCCFMALKIPC